MPAKRKLNFGMVGGAQNAFINAANLDGQMVVNTKIAFAGCERDNEIANDKDIISLHNHLEKPLDFA
jgi:hypothetical protein